MPHFGGHAVSAARLDGRGKRNPKKSTGHLFLAPNSFAFHAVCQSNIWYIEQDSILGTGYFDADMFLNSLSGSARYYIVKWSLDMFLVAMKV